MGSSEYGGWLNESMSLYFTNYADACFKSFGDRVKHWITFNEPLSFSISGYSTGAHAPGRCSNRSICNAGNTSTEPYIVTHNVLLSHAAAVHLYRTKYQSAQNGKIGITLNCDWSQPFTNSLRDRAAAERHLEFQLSWFADPVFFGDYPQVMKDLVGTRLPAFTPDQKISLRGSHDFFALNHYTSTYASHPVSPPPTDPSWDSDQNAFLTREKDGKFIGPAADSSWLYVVPWGIRRMLNWVNDRYQDTEIYITENGVDVPKESSMPLQEALNDTFRVNFLKDYIAEVGNAIQDGVPVKGYFLWSLMDNFEWADGYSKRFGIHYVDYTNGEKRYQKNSAKWYSNFIAQFKRNARKSQKF